MVEGSVWDEVADRLQLGGGEVEVVKTSCWMEGIGERVVEEVS